MKCFVVKEKSLKKLKYCLGPFENENAPKAYLNLIFIPEYDSLDLVKDISFAYDQIDGGSSQLIGELKNQNFDEMRIDNFVAPAQGYILVYLSNENSKVVEVYFDDLEVDIKILMNILLSR